MCLCCLLCVCVLSLCVRFRFWFGLFGRDLYSSARSVAHKYNTIFCLFFLFSFCSFSLLLLCCFAFFASPKSANTLLPSQIRRRPPNRTPTEPNRRGPIIINNNFRQLGPRAPHRQYQRAKTKAKNVRHGAGRVG